MDFLVAALVPKVQMGYEYMHICTKLTNKIITMCTLHQFSARAL